MFFCDFMHALDIFGRLCFKRDGFFVMNPLLLIWSNSITIYYLLLSSEL